MDSIECVAYLISQQVFDLTNAFMKIEHYPTSKREIAFRNRVEDFIYDIDDLHDVFNKHEQHLKKKWKKHTNYVSMDSTGSFIMIKVVQESENLK